MTMIRFDEPTTAVFEDYAIKGKMLQTSVMSELEMSGMSEMEMKRFIARELVDALINHKLIEFTSIINPSTITKMYRGRVFVTPDDQVRIIRTKTQICSPGSPLLYK